MSEPGFGRIPFATELGEDAKPYYEIAVPRPGEPVVGVMATQTWLAMPTHYVWPRTHAHYEPAEGCPYCQQGIGIRVRCFVGSWDYKKGRYMIQQFSPSAATSCKQLKGLQGKLRGWQLTTIRAGKSQQSRILAQVEYYRERDLPPAFDLAEALQRIYQGGLTKGEI